MKEIKEIFENIGFYEIDENSDDLVDSGVLDSANIIMLITQIEEKYDICVNYKYLKAENFKNFKSILNLIEMIKKETK